MARKIVIIGAGTYGSYLAKCLAIKYPDDKIELYEVGNAATRSEQEIGYASRVKGGIYKAARDGRFFGLGGTSAKWGGQLLFFSHKDFADESSMREVVDCNVRYREKVLNRFFSKVPQLSEDDIGDGLFVKKGIWLKFGQRNIYDNFKISGLANVKVVQNARVIRLNSDAGKISSMSVLIDDGRELDIEAGVFYLTSGAFESLRLLNASGIRDIEESSQGFSDHVTLRCFEFEGKEAQIASHDFQFQFVEGSMVTSRIVGEIDGVSYYVHPIFNEDFNFFQFLKGLIFKREFSIKGLMYAGKQFVPTLAFAYSYLIKKKLFIYGKWFLHINIELSESGNSIALSQELDRFGQNGIELDYAISQDTADKLMRVKQQIKQLLIDSEIPFKEIDSSQMTAENLEDVYHPYGVYP